MSLRDRAMNMLVRGAQQPKMHLLLLTPQQRRLLLRIGEQIVKVFPRRIETQHKLESGLSNGQEPRSHPIVAAEGIRTAVNALRDRNFSGFADIIRLSPITVSL